MLSSLVTLMQVTNAFGELLTECCNENNLIPSDEVLLLNNSFTYCSDAHYTTSWLDHFLCTHSAHSFISRIEVLFYFISSDHHPIALSVNILVTGMSDADDEDYDEFQGTNLNWYIVSPDDTGGHYLQYHDTFSVLVPVPSVLWKKSTGIAVPVLLFLNYKMVLGTFAK